MRRSPIEPAELAAVRAEARAELWRLGNLRHLLHPGQREVYDSMKAHRTQWTRVVLEISRKFGKSWFLLAWLAEQCIKNPGQRFVYGAPTYVQLREFAFPIMRALESLAPADVRPKFREKDGHWLFPNGAWVHLFACDDLPSAERGRGPMAREAAFDECGATPGDVLSYVISDVFRPSLMLCEAPLTILSGTPSREPLHPFTQMAELAETQGNYFHRTIYDNPMLTPERVEAIIAENARDEGMSVEQYKQTSGFKREYMADRAIDRSLVVLPEWVDKRATSLVAVPRPDFFNAQVILDFGGHDPHFAHFSYWHFPLAKYVIEDELCLRDGENTHELQGAVKAKEKALWGVEKWSGALRCGTDAPEAKLTENLPPWLADILVKEAPEQPFARWADNDIQLCRDLYELHGLAFIPTSKDQKELQVNHLRVMLNSDQVLLHPRCINTDRHWRQTVWKDHKRKDFKRTASGEHGDGVDVGVYGVRNLDRRNPFPPGYGLVPGQRARAAPVADWGADMLSESRTGRRLLGARRR